MTTPHTRTNTLCKRNGEIVAFDPRKIERSITAAGDGIDEFGPAMAWMVAHAVETYLANRSSLDTAQVQSMVEQQLMAAGYFRTARAFILQHEQRQMEQDDLARVSDDARAAANPVLASKHPPYAQFPVNA